MFIKMRLYRLHNIYTAMQFIQDYQLFDDVN